MSATNLMFARTVRQAGRNIGVAYGQPIVMAVVIGAVFNALFSGISEVPGFPEVSYLDWIVPGTLFLSAVVGAGFGAAELLRDAQSGYLDRVRVSPSNPAGLLLGRMLFELGRGLVAATVVLSIGLAMGAENHNGILGFADIVFMTGGLAFAWNGIFFWSAVKTLNPAAVLGLQPLFFPVVLFSTWFAPPSFMPDWYATIARLNPISAFLDGQRSILRGESEWDLIAISTTFIVSLSAVTFLFASRAYRNLATAS